MKSHLRLYFNIALIISTLFLPWWITAPLLFLATLLVPRFYEVICYGLVIDAMYGTTFGFHGFTYVWTAATAVTLALMEMLRPWLSWEA